MHYLDCKHVFLAPGGTRLEASFMRDALHPTAKGEKAWFAVLKPKLTELINVPPPRHPASWSLPLVAGGTPAAPAAAAGLHSKL